MASGDFSGQALAALGYDPTAAELLLVQNAERAKTLLVYRVNSSGVRSQRHRGRLDRDRQNTAGPGQRP